MEEKTIIYVAGNPDAYPVEYYNEDSQTYEGVIPGLLRDFSEQSSYDIIYYDAGVNDNRDELYKNNQVDIISANTGESGSWNSTDTLAVISLENEQGKITYYLSFTDAAPEELRVSLQSYIDGITQENINGLFSGTVQTYSESLPYRNIVFGLSGCILVLIILILILVRKYRKKLRASQQETETDKTTGLGNTNYLKRYYRQFVSDKNRVLYELLYFYVDTNSIRKAASTEETDEFLRYCAVILQEYTDDTDILAKVSDHGFVLLKMNSNMEKTDKLLKAILERIRDYSKQFSKCFDANVAVGVYLLKQQDRNLDEMIFQASQGAELAFENGEDYTYCSDKMLQKCMQDRQLQASMEEAFAGHEFQLYIQFYVDAVSGRIVGGEALSRWNHPRKGLLNPDDFVPLMERERMISRLDYYCLNEVCEFLEWLTKNGVDRFFVSCNFSRDTLAESDFAERLKNILERYDFPRELLIVEITESIETKDVIQMQNNIAALKECGVGVTLDDFGKGFTSFFDLQKYNVDGVKVDKELVDHIFTQRGSTILRSMIQVGHELQMTILAEGVETKEQAETLRSMGCDVIQGYYFYMPLPDWEAKRKILQQFSA